MSPLDAVLEELAELVAAKVLARMAAPSSHYTTRAGGVHVPGKSRAWALRTLKTIPGARKVGRDWVVSVEAYEAWLTDQDTKRAAGKSKGDGVKRLRTTSTPLPSGPSRRQAFARCARRRARRTEPSTWAGRSRATSSTAAVGRYRRRTRSAREWHDLKIDAGPEERALAQEVGTAFARKLRAGQFVPSERETTGLRFRDYYEAAEKGHVGRKNRGRPQAAIDGRCSRFTTWIPAALARPAPHGWREGRRPAQAREAPRRRGPRARGLLPWREHARRQDRPQARALRQERGVRVGRSHERVP